MRDRFITKVTYPFHTCKRKFLASIVYGRNNPPCDCPTRTAHHTLTLGALGRSANLSGHATLSTVVVLCRSLSEACAIGQRLYRHTTADNQQQQHCRCSGQHGDFYLSKMLSWPHLAVGGPRCDWLEIGPICGFISTISVCSGLSGQHPGASCSSSARL